MTPPSRAEASLDAPPAGRLQRLLRKAWWLHSAWALGFGVTVMLFARAGLAHADKVLMALCGSWLLMFVALRFVVGPANRKTDESVARRGFRVATNYVIKQFYQQMFFFLVPLYASSATWSLASFNWWPAPVLFVCAVLSTLDLVFDNFIMERRFLASVMYGLAMFGVLNVSLPLVTGMSHYQGLLLAAAATPVAVALLSFSVTTVLSPQGTVATVLATAGLLAAVWFGRALVPPAPLVMRESTVGHGAPGAFECLPASKHVILDSQLTQLRCGSLLVEPGGVKEKVVHVWRHAGREVARVHPDELACDGDDVVYRSTLDPALLATAPRGAWQCVTETEGGQLVGIRRFRVVGADGSAENALPPAIEPPPATEAPPPIEPPLPADAAP
jgi:hypothetical protein